MLRTGTRKIRESSGDRHFRDEDALEAAEQGHVQAGVIPSGQPALIDDGFEEDDPYNRTGKFIYLRPRR